MSNVHLTATGCVFVPARGSVALSKFLIYTNNIFLIVVFISPTEKNTSYISLTNVVFFNSTDSYTMWKTVAMARIICFLKK